jgi:ABC-type bacteriocin/lantibiotic exporter with double-glycine peptidase domain
MGVGRELWNEHQPAGMKISSRNLKVSNGPIEIYAHYARLISIAIQTSGFLDDLCYILKVNTNVSSCSLLCPRTGQRSSNSAPAPMSPILSVRNLEWEKAPGQPIFSNVNFNLEEGDFLVLTGKSGTG